MGWNIAQNFTKFCKSRHWIMRCALWTVRILVMMGTLLMGDLLGLWAKDVEPVAWGPGCCPWLGNPLIPSCLTSLLHTVVWWLCPSFPGALWECGEIWYADPLKSSRCVGPVWLVESASLLSWCFFSLGTNEIGRGGGAHGAVTLYWTAHWDHLFTSSQTS